MAELRAFQMGANVVTLHKDKKFCAMTCAWAMMCDYDKILLLLGSQSDTGKSINIGDKVGVSALSKGQGNIAGFFGENHSLSFSKFNQHYLERYQDVYVVKEAKVQMVCEVIDILHLKGSEKDNLVQLKVVEFRDNDSLDFLEYKEL